MPFRLVEDNDGMGVWGDVGRDFLQMKVHGGAVATWAGRDRHQPLERDEWLLLVKFLSFLR